ncbi:hypothetical protein ACJMK2_002834 [Sinanodonta woodiana]|uniref:Transposable element P transposase-like RNase H domain-containing protein n=1 Tax=Sinanodonta woodiana TaxID=1069815 RepID=A0ABD3XWE8_SINWO
MKQKQLEKKENENPLPACNQFENIISVLSIIAPNLTKNQLTLLCSQIMASNLKNSKGMRWPREVISMAITLYNRNPSAYRDVTKNGWLHLPSEQLLSLYKNAVCQGPGIIPQMMEWMLNEAQRQNLTQEGYFGGLILDEMSIQEDIQIIHYKSGSSSVGLTDSGPEIMMIHTSSMGKAESKMANNVLQYIFRGITGFRWPFANYPNTQESPCDLFITTWKCVDALYEYGFKAIYCCTDGSSNNRAFLEMHFLHQNPIETKMVAKYYRNSMREIIFMMDPCHLLKKIRNSILSRGFEDFHKRHLTVDGFFIIWKMWIDAYKWDHSTNIFPVHQKLSDEHMFPNDAQKMRNKLAFETLNHDMLNLMTMYQESA